jgi:hypothetical protein
MGQFYITLKRGNLVLLHEITMVKCFISPRNKVQTLSKKSETI